MGHWIMAIVLFYEVFVKIILEVSEKRQKVYEIDFFIT